MKKAANALRYLLPISGTLVAILGITTLFAPLENLGKLIAFVGPTLLLAGISQVGSVLWDGKSKLSRIALASGVLSALLGARMLAMGASATAADSLPFVLGLWSMSTGIAGVCISLSFKSEGLPLWGLTMALSAAGSVLGVPLLLLLLLLPISFSAHMSGIILAAWQATILAAWSRALAFMFIAHGVNGIAVFFSLDKARMAKR